MPRQNIFLFTGENAYLLGKELRTWKMHFCEKHGAENLTELFSKQATRSDIVDAVSVMPFIAEKRLVLLYGIPSLEKEQVEPLLAEVHPQTVFVIIEPKPDKRLTVTKEIMKQVTVKEFAPLTERELVQWLSQETKKNGLQADSGTIASLRDLVGDNPLMLSTEIKRLATFAGGKKLDAQEMRDVTLPSGERLIWELTNLVGQRKVTEAVAFLRAQVERGENPYSLWTILIDMMRKVTAVWALKNEGASASAIASELKMNPLAVRGVLPLVESLTEDDLLALHTLATETDFALKTGGLRYTAESPQEILAATERLILACG